MSEFPDTALVHEALHLAQACLLPSIFQHSRRVFLLGRAYAERLTLAFDQEDLWLAALFHDLGLSDRFRDSSQAFTQIGGDLVQQFLAERGASERGQHLAEAIDLHMQLWPRWSKGPVAGLLQVGAWMDASKVHAGTLAPGVIASIEAAFPRADFDRVFRARLLGSFGSFKSCARLVFPRARARVS